MNLEELVRDALSLPVNAIAYSVSGRLAAEHRDKAILEGDDDTFDVEEYAVDGHCKIHVLQKVHSQVATEWDGSHKRPYRTVRNAWLAVEWKGHVLDVLLMQWTEMRCTTDYYWVIAESSDLAARFFEAVCAWCEQVRGQVLVFSGGHWQKSESLFKSIQSATFDNLVLPPALKQEIRTDFRQFFNSRKLYEQYGIPWKRGVLLIGPPGNGKTHTVKALLNLLRKPCLYVQSFKAQYRTDHDCIRDVFKRAREMTPCVMVLEDLDSLLTEGNRSYFLNELDGFAANSGMVILGTTNHPERLDPSILERPSRFDRKYHFDPPASPERAAYLRLWNEQLQPELQISAAAAREIESATEGFSYAYLKELILSSMMRWISSAVPGKMGEIALSQIPILKEQMMSAPPEPRAVYADSDDDE